MKKNGFVISTMLYSIFGIMIIIVFYILYLLVSNKSLLISSIDEIKNNLEITNTEEKIYIHFAVSDYLKDKYSNDFFQGIKLKVEEQLKQETNNTYIIDIGSEYTTLSEEKTSGISYEYSILNSHSEGSRYMNYHGSFGNYVIITETGSSRGGDKYNGYYVNGNMRAFLVNVLDPSEKISIIDSDFGPYHNDYRYMYVSIDKKNNYIYVKGMTEDETLVVSSSSGVYNGINFSINYSKSKYDPEDFSIINTENAYVYTSGTGKNIKFSYTANFNQIHNEWYTLNGAGVNGYNSSLCQYVDRSIGTLCVPLFNDKIPSVNINLHTNSVTYPSNYNDIRQKFQDDKQHCTYSYDQNGNKNKTCDRNYRYDYKYVDLDPYQNVFEKEDFSGGILFTPATPNSENSSTSTREVISIIWYKQPIQYNDEVLNKISRQITGKDYNKRYYIFIKDDVEDGHGNYHFSVSPHLKNTIPDYTKLMYLGEETTTVVQSSLDTDTIYNSYTSELSIDNIANDLINLIKNN